ncbi:MAG: glutamate racemase [Campylobacterales bacterium]|nr:glutamate racemase [Campylobacterales bacterium]
MRVGVFDSGIGGLTVVKSLREHGLFEEIIYFGDTARVPYGVKDQNTIIRYALEALEFFKNFDIDLLIVACNTVSAYALDALRTQAPFEVVGVVEAGVLATCNALSSTDASILILGTKATVRSQAYEKQLHVRGFTRLSSKATGLFVPIVEEGIFEGPVLESLMEHYFADLATPDAIILGCTHFPLIEAQIARYFSDAPRLIHSGEAMVEYLHVTHGLSRRARTCDMKFFASENPEALKAVAAQWLRL